MNFPALATSVLFRAFVRDWRFFWLHWLTSVSGIAIAVCIVSAVSIAIDQTKRAIERNHAGLNAGSAYRIESGRGWIEEGFYSRAVLVDGIGGLEPVIEAWISLGKDSKKALLLGLDLMRSTSLSRSTDSPQIVERNFFRLLSEPGAVAAGPALLREFGAAQGEALQIGFGDRQSTAHAVASIAPSFVADYPTFDRVIVADISTAQELLGVEGYLTYINVAAGVSAEQLAQLTRSVEQRSPELALVAQQQRLDEAAALPRAFYTNIEIIGWLALLLGAMIALNATLYVVRLRRPVVGTLRAIGVTSREILLLQGFSFFLTGIVGTVLGLSLGVLASDGLYVLTLRTVNELFEATTWLEQPLAAATLAKGFMVGIGAALAGAAISAWQARAVPPVTLMRERMGFTRSPLIRWGVALVLASLALVTLLGTSSGFLGVHGALFALLAGFVLVCTDLVAFGARLVGLLVRPYAQSLSLWGLRNIPRLKRFYALAVASLVVAIGVAMALQIMVGSFRAAVEQWITQGFDADFYVSLNNLLPGDSFSASDQDRLAQLSGVRAVLASSKVSLRVNGVALDVFAGEPLDRVQMRFPVINGAVDDVDDGGSLLVTEALAFFRGFKLGDRLDVDSAYGKKTFRVAGIVRDYSSGQGYAMMSRSALAALMATPPITSLAVYLESDARGRLTGEQLRAALATDSSLRIRDSAFIKSFTLEVFDRTFEIITVLSAVVIVTSCLGVMIALFTAQTEKRSDYRILRMLGVTPAEIGGLVYREVVVIAALSAAVAIPLAYLLAYFFCHKLMKQSFGWSFPLQAELLAVLGIFLMGLAGSLAAGALVARVTARIPSSEAINAASR